METSFARNGRLVPPKRTSLRSQRSMRAMTDPAQVCPRCERTARYPDFVITAPQHHVVGADQHRHFHCAIAREYGAMAEIKTGTTPGNIISLSAPPEVGAPAVAPVQLIVPPCRTKKRFRVNVLHHLVEPIGREAHVGIQKRRRVAASKDAPVRRERADPIGSLLRITRVSGRSIWMGRMLPSSTRTISRR